MIASRSGSSSLKILLVFFFSFSLFVLYGQSHFYRDPGSVFYDQARAYEQEYSAVRLQQVEYFRNAVKLHGNKAFNSGPPQRRTPEICVTMTTVFRQGLERQYVEDAVLSMLDGITSQERALLHLNLLFTDLNATVHPSWHQPWLRGMLDSTWSYDDKNARITPEVRSWLESMTSSDIATKATMDYTLALQKCLDDTEAPYIAAFEGDTLFAAGWVAPTLRALRSADTFTQQKTKSWWSSSEQTQDWIFMRIFNQERSTGWASRRIGGNNEMVAIIAIDLVLSLAVLLLRNRSVISSHGLDNLSLAVICLLVIPVSVVGFFQAGKASLLPPRPGLAVENFGCCSQALIFNRKHVSGLIDYLRDFAMQEANGQSEHLNYDMRTRDFADENGLDRLALYPVQVQHMGIKSTLGLSQTEAQSVWSMAYEYLRDSDVTARHDKAMDELFGTEWRAAEQNS